ncbi:hypothetical protein A7D00_3526 [Trichophyton violaceum]|uniref:Peptide hydrolase n=1 Tax=Trichophyton violaceum TaxID=34388 RepID=A0A178FKG4_TRIVO|nr:hypothetical protein A7D00_3526 [Trichophyton violaceum]
MKVLAALALSALAMAKPTPPMLGMSLVQTGPQETRWVTAKEKHDMVMNHVGFFDITNRPETASIASKPKSYAFPGNVSHQAEVKPLIEKISADHIKANLEKFSSYPNRYYNAQSGVESAQWVMEQAQMIVGNIQGAKVEMVKHDWMQPSIRAIIPGKSEKIVAVGAHQDSINGNNPQGKAPGADDNGSGSMTILEALMVLVSDQKIAGGEAANTLELHWYAGEEEGLLGSQDIFQQYSQEGKEVVAMPNQDMTGYGETMGVITDNSDPKLTKFTKMILDTYTSAKYADSECGYACSDHASANKAGFPSAFVYEAVVGQDNPAIHSPDDTIEKLDPAKMAEHAKLVVGFAYELAFATLSIMNDLRSYDLYTSLVSHSDSITSASNTLTEGTAIALSTALLYPLDSILTRLQVRYASQHHAKESNRARTRKPLDVLGDIIDLAAKNVKDAEARAVLYAGLREAVCKQTLENMLVPAVYGALHARRLNLGRTVGNELVLSIVSMAFVKLLTEPLGTIMVRRQATGSSTRCVVDDVLRQKGVGGLWSGYGATLVLSVRSCVLPVVYLALRRRLGLKRGGLLGMLVLRAVVETVVYRLAVLQCCARAGVKAVGKGSLMLEVIRTLSSQGVRTATSDFVAVAMMRLSAVMLYMLEPLLLSEQAITNSVRENVDAGANQPLLDDAKYMNNAVKRAISIVNRGIGLASHGRDDVAVAELVGDYVEDGPEDG